MSIIISFLQKKKKPRHFLKQETVPILNHLHNSVRKRYKPEAQQSSWYNCSVVRMRWVLSKRKRSVVNTVDPSGISSPSEHTHATGVWPVCCGLCWKQLGDRHGLGKLARPLDAHWMTPDRAAGAGGRKSHRNLGQHMSTHLRVP